MAFQARFCWPNKRAGNWISVSFVAALLGKDRGIFKEIEHGF